MGCCEREVSSLLLSVFEGLQRRPRCMLSEGLGLTPQYLFFPPS